MPALYDATGNTRLAALDAQMGKELRIYRRHGLAFGGGLAVSNVEHRAILAAVEQGDRVAAGRELEKHIQNGRDRFIRAMSATGQLVLKEAAGARLARKRSKSLHENPSVSNVFRSIPAGARISCSCASRPTPASSDGARPTASTTATAPSPPQVEELGRYLVGRDPFHIRHILQIAFDDYAQRRGSLEFYCATSGIEQALWDIAGKVTEQPVYNLLGGPVPFAQFASTRTAGATRCKSRKTMPAAPKPCSSAASQR